MEVSADYGKTLVTLASLEIGKWPWVPWEARVHVAREKERRILMRSTRKARNMRDDWPWNLRALAYNGLGEARGMRSFDSRGWNEINDYKCKKFNSLLFKTKPITEY